MDGTGGEKYFRVAGSTIPCGSTLLNPAGVFVTFTRDGDCAYRIREKNGLTYTFENTAPTVGQQAKLLTISDRNGNTLTLGYTNGLLTTVTDALQRSLTLQYNAGNRLEEVRDFANRQHQYGYDASGNLTSYKNPLAVAGPQNPVIYTYYGTAPLAHVLASYTLPRGNGMKFEYYLNGKVFRHCRFETAIPAACTDPTKT
ncbi:MAG: hypothetical protein WC713_05505, partial [Candidatus Methylomirabilota bacterium]